MIVTKTENGLTQTYSDRNVKIHGGNPEGDYDIAIDPAGSGRTYTETEIPIGAERSNQQSK